MAKEHSSHGSESATDSTDSSGEALTEQEASQALGELSAAFRASARRWEIIVYPALVAFFLLAIYGFFLIYNLTRDAQEIAGHMGVVAERMEKVSGDMTTVSQRMNEMTQTSQHIATKLDAQTKAVKQMNANIGHMRVSIHRMQNNVDRIRYHFAVWNDTAGRPMSLMNQFLP
jgi:uncharacterized protein YoxC